MNNPVVWKMSFLYLLMSTLLLLPSIVLCAEIYKWTDDEGKIHFGDTMPAREEVKTITSNTTTGRAKLQIIKIAADASITADIARKCENHLDAGGDIDNFGECSNLSNAMNKLSKEHNKFEMIVGDDTTWDRLYYEALGHVDYQQYFEDSDISIRVTKRAGILIGMDILKKAKNINKTLLKLQKPPLFEFE